MATLLSSVALNRVALASLADGSGRQGHPASLSIQHMDLAQPGPRHRAVDRCFSPCATGLGGAVSRGHGPGECDAHDPVILHPIAIRT